MVCLAVDQGLGMSIHPLKDLPKGKFHPEDGLSVMVYSEP